MKLINLFLAFLFFVSVANAQKIMGFTDADAAKQIDWEKQFDAQLNSLSRGHRPLPRRASTHTENPSIIPKIRGKPVVVAKVVHGSR